MPTKDVYLKIIEKAYQREKGRVAEEYEQGLAQIRAATPLFGFSPPRWMQNYAATCAFLYARNGDSQLAEQAKSALKFYQEWLGFLPADAASQRPEYADGIPPLEIVFQPLIFVPTVQNLRSALTGSELEVLVGLLADSLKLIWLFPEWGGHNRAMLRAAGLAMSAQAFPDHLDASQWASLADELAEESWGRWSIEDAMLYQPHWLRALFLYTEARGREVELKDMIQPRMHLKAPTQLISPLGILPDFGDSHWLNDSQWEWMACLEWGAASYHDPAMKWAANRIYQSRSQDVVDAYTATVAALAWKWCDESVPAHPPVNRDDALDDLVMKKKVWRTGWEADASYACLNYRDEGDYGRVARDYLRTTLAVTAEKMHHGHADEGSFNMLIHKGTLLLHESGYRESPPDGIYRSAVYHNRLVWRPERKPDGFGLLEFLRGDGRYQAVRTERLYQTHLGDAEFIRVRTSDEASGLTWDRSIVFLPELPCWIVMDSALATRTQFRTISSLWWTTKLLAQGEDWFETHISSVMSWQNRKDAALLVCMPAVRQHPGILSVEPFRRSFQDEIALARTWTGEHRTGNYINFITVLWPHAFADLDENRPKAVEVVESDPTGRGIAVRLRWRNEEGLFGTLNDLNLACGQEDIRPTYTAERGKVSYGPVSSDAAFFSLRKSPQGEWAGFINGTYLSLNERILFQGKLHAMFQEDRSALPGIPARFRWESKFG
jgi:hypothetical protein